MKSQKLLAMVLCLGEPPVRFLCSCCSFLMCIFICRCSFHSFPGYFTMSPTLHPGFSGPWRPPPALSSTPTTFDCLFCFIYRERYGFQLAFFTHRRFLPYAPSWHFGTTCFYQGLPGSRHLFLEICRASYWSSKHRPGPSVCLVHSNPQSFLHLKFVFVHVNIAKKNGYFLEHKFRIWIWKKNCVYNAPSKNTFQSISLEY